MKPGGGGGGGGQGSGQGGGLGGGQGSGQGAGGGDELSAAAENGDYFSNRQNQSWRSMKPGGVCGTGQGERQGAGQEDGRGAGRDGRGDERSSAAAENVDSFSNRQSQLEADNETCSTSVEAPATQIHPSFPPRSVSNKQWAKWVVGSW